MENIILNHQDIENVTNRIAYQIYETFINDKELTLVGIVGNGYIFAKMIESKLKQISDFKITLGEVIINKQNPIENSTSNLTKQDYINKGIVVIDDVLNSGSTLIYGIKYFLDVPINKCKTAVLIDRNHKKFPVKVDFKGISLSTSLSEHVQVIFEEGNNRALLV
jgi:pyrimidine operon attenuation protein / uracil phosphoribosyltransferase